MKGKGVIKTLVNLLCINLVSSFSTRAGRNEDLRKLTSSQEIRSALLPLLIQSEETPSSEANAETARLPPRKNSTGHPHNHEAHKTVAAKGIIETLLLQTSTKERARKAPAPKEISFHDGETIATIFTDLHGNITKCSLFEIKRIEESEKILEEFAMANRPVQTINFRTMLSVITACQAIDPIFSKLHASLNNSITYSTGRPPSQLDVLSMRTVISGILPGTKWCGLGDIASDYEDLGIEKDLDKCCRAHDHCPTKLRSFRSGYGLVNWSLYTKSHCECDSLLYECLKGARTPTAELLGNFYFNVLQVQCIDEEDLSKCLAREENGQGCLVWEDDADKKMIFRDVRRHF